MEEDWFDRLKAELQAVAAGQHKQANDAERHQAALDAKLRAFWPLFKSELRRYVERLRQDLAGTRCSKITFQDESGVVPGSIGADGIELTLNDYPLSQIKLTFEAEGHLIRVEAKQKSKPGSAWNTEHFQIDISLTGEALTFDTSELPIGDRNALLNWTLRTVLDPLLHASK